MHALQLTARQIPIRFVEIACIRNSVNFIRPTPVTPTLHISWLVEQIRRKPIFQQNNDLNNCIATAYKTHQFNCDHLAHYVSNFRRL